MTSLAKTMATRRHPPQPPHSRSVRSDHASSQLHPAARSWATNSNSSAFNHRPKSPGLTTTLRVPTPTISAPTASCRAQCENVRANFLALLRPLRAERLPLFSFTRIVSVRCGRRRCLRPNRERSRALSNLANTPKARNVYFAMTKAPLWDASMAVSNVAAQCIFAALFLAAPLSGTASESCARSTLSSRSTMILFPSLSSERPSPRSSSSRATAANTATGPVTIARLAQSSPVIPACHVRTSAASCQTPSIRNDVKCLRGFRSRGSTTVTTA